MAVSKRLRYEILRRDNHACRYCGAAAPGVKLHVDHVIPQALGGSDVPTNLVTACAECNAGKTSSMPNAMPVADVEQEAFRQAAVLRKDAEFRREAISLHLYLVWMWAYEETGRVPSEREQQWFMEETHKTLACGYSARVDLTKPAYKAGLANALDIQSYITLPGTAASPEDVRFVNSIDAVEAWATAWNFSTETRDPCVREVEVFIAAVHKALDSGRASCDVTYAAHKAGRELSLELEHFLDTSAVDANEGVN
jgi:hypothetical protein